MNQPDDKTITLRKPVTVGSAEAGVTYTELKLREPTAGELEKAMGATSSVGIAITLIHLISGLPRLAVEKLSQRDFTEANEYLGGFTDGGPADAESSSPMSLTSTVGAQT